MNKKITSVTHPVQQGIISHRFKTIHYTQDKLVILWDMGDITQPKPTPDVWCYMEYTDVTGEEKAIRRMRFVAGVLNGLRHYHEVADQA